MDIKISVKKPKIVPITVMSPIKKIKKHPIIK